MARTVLLSLGGNAILPGRGAGTIEEQFRITRDSMVHVADLLQEGARVILTHGNGPIVGNILLRNELAKDRIPPMPLDVCGADSQGGIGYMIQQTLHNVLRERGVERTVASIVTQVVVDRDDPAFHDPTKPIGPFYSPEEAKRLRASHGWTLLEDSGRGYRRVVPSPLPQRIVEEALIRDLFEAGHVVIAAGGGGIPVLEEDGRLRGVEAVIDKDRTAVLLALCVGASVVINVTSIDQVAVRFGTPDQRALGEIDIEEARAHYAAGQFPPGSMGPKIEAAISFLEQGGEAAIITSPPLIAKAVQGIAGTRIVSAHRVARAR